MKQFMAASLFTQFELHFDPSAGGKAWAADALRRTAANVHETRTGVARSN
jgi:hypothetical protein